MIFIAIPQDSVELAICKRQVGGDSALHEDYSPLNQLARHVCKPSKTMARLVT